MDCTYLDGWIEMDGYGCTCVCMCKTKVTFNKGTIYKCKEMKWNEMKCDHNKQQTNISILMKMKWRKWFTKFYLYCIEWYYWPAIQSHFLCLLCYRWLLVLYFRLKINDNSTNTIWIFDNYGFHIYTHSIGVYSLLGNVELVNVNTVGGVGFTSPSFSLSDTVASVLPAELIGFTSFGLTGIVLNAPPANM